MHEMVTHMNCLTSLSVYQREFPLVHENQLQLNECCIENDPEVGVIKKKENFKSSIFNELVFSKTFNWRIVFDSVIIDQF